MMAFLTLLLPAGDVILKLHPAAHGFLMKTRSKRWSSDGDIFGVVLFLKASLLETVLGSWHY